MVGQNERTNLLPHKWCRGETPKLPHQDSGALAQQAVCQLEGTVDGMSFHAMVVRDVDTGFMAVGHSAPMKMWRALLSWSGGAEPDLGLQELSGQSVGWWGPSTTV